jgi:hypothetical protein
MMHRTKIINDISMLMHADSIPSACFKVASPDTQHILSAMRSAAASQKQILQGTPGGVVKRKTTSGHFFYRQYCGSGGKRRDEYIGPCESESGIRLASEMQVTIENAKEIARLSAKLKKSAHRFVEDELISDYIDMINNRFFDEGVVLVGECAVPPLLAYLQIAKFSPPVGQCWGKAQLTFAGKKIGHVMRRGAASLAPEWVDFVQYDSVSSVAIARRTAVNVRVPEPVRFALCSLAMISVMTDQFEIFKLAILSKSVLLIHDPKGILLSKVVETAPIELLAAASRGVEASMIASDMHKGYSE